MTSRSRKFDRVPLLWVVVIVNVSVFLMALRWHCSAWSLPSAHVRRWVSVGSSARLNGAESAPSGVGGNDGDEVFSGGGGPLFEQARETASVTTR